MLGLWSLLVSSLEHRGLTHNTRDYRKHWVVFFSSTMEEGKRVHLLMVAAFFAGASIGPLIDLVLTVDQGFIIRAFVGTAMVFGWFSVATLLTQRRVFIYLVGSLFSSLSITILLTIASTIFDGYFIWDSNLPFLLGLCAGYIMLYSQVIIEQASRGNLDHVGRALSSVFCLLVLSLLLPCLLEKPNEGDKGKMKKRS